MNDSRDDEETRNRPPDDTAAGQEPDPPEEDVKAEEPADDSTRTVSSAVTPETAAATSGEGGSGPDSGSASAAPPRGGRFLAAFALLLALAAAVAAGYLGWRLYQLEQRVGAIPDERAAALEPYLQPDALRPLRSRIESLEDGREDLARDVEERVDRLQDSVESVRAMTERHQIGWRLAEIRYLLSIAARRLLIAHDTEGAEAALAAADASVAELRDVRLLPLRQAIVEDLDAVRAVEPTDIEGIALRLQRLLVQVDSLPRAPLREAGGDDDARADDTGWWQRLRGMLSDFVVVQRRPAGREAVAPKADEGLRPADALTLALQDARRAALARNGGAFDAAMEQADSVLEQHFDPQSGTTARFTESLAELRGRSVETELPDLSDTLELAQRLARDIEQAREPDEPDAQPAEEE